MDADTTSRQYSPAHHHSRPIELSPPRLFHFQPLTPSPSPNPNPKTSARPSPTSSQQCLAPPEARPATGTICWPMAPPSASSSLTSPSPLTAAVPPRAAARAQLAALPAALPAAPTRLVVYVSIPHLTLLVIAANVLDAIAKLWRHQALIKVSVPSRATVYRSVLLAWKHFMVDLRGWFSRYDFTHLQGCLSGAMTWIG